MSMARVARWLGGVILVAVAAATALWWWGLRTPALPMPAVAGRVEQRQMEHGGLVRSYLLYRPLRLAPDAPIVLVLHGSAASGERMRRATAGAFDVIADREGAMVVYPDGHLAHWNDCRTADGNPARDAAVDDVGFLRALVAQLPGDPALAPDGPVSRPVFVFGLSNGGHMGLRLALEAPDLVQGVVAVAASLPAPGNTDCVPAVRPVPVLFINGDADPVSPYGGGTVRLIGPFGNRGDILSSQASVEYFQQLVGYSEGPFEHRYPDEDPADGTVATRQVWAAPGLPEVALITIHGGGHTIPHPAKEFPRVLGRTSHDLSAAEEAFRFFRRQVSRDAGATGG
jgi:polyhydroxybutyrate depolymerase